MTFPAQFFCRCVWKVRNVTADAKTQLGVCNFRQFVGALKLCKTSARWNAVIADKLSVISGCARRFFPRGRAGVSWWNWNKARKNGARHIIKNASEESAWNVPANLHLIRLLKLYGNFRICFLYLNDKLRRAGYFCSSSGVTDKYRRQFCSGFSKFLRKFWRWELFRRVYRFPNRFLYTIFHFSTRF